MKLSIKLAHLKINLMQVRIGMIRLEVFRERGCLELHESISNFRTRLNNKYKTEFCEKG